MPYTRLRNLCNNYLFAAARLCLNLAPGETSSPSVFCQKQGQWFVFLSLENKQDYMLFLFPFSHIIFRCSLDADIMIYMNPYQMTVNTPLKIVVVGKESSASHAMVQI